MFQFFVSLYSFCAIRERLRDLSRLPLDAWHGFAAISCETCQGGELYPLRSTYLMHSCATAATFAAHIVCFSGGQGSGANSLAGSPA